MAGEEGNSIRCRDTAGFHLVANYQTQASRDFSDRGSRHRDDNGRFLDTKRLTDDIAMIDANDMVHPAHATHALSYSLPDPRFTLMEHLVFALAYQEHPAKFGAISQFLAGRSAEDCVRHYYRHKLDGRFKNESRRQRYDRLECLKIDGAIRLPPTKELDMESLPDWDIRLRGVRLRPFTATDAEEEYHDNGRKKRNAPVRGKASLPACGISQSALIHLVPIDIHITELKRALGISAGAKVFAKAKPPSRWEREIFPRPLHLDLLSQNFRHPYGMSDNELMHWLRSEQVLPLVREWFVTVVDDPDLGPQLLALLAETSHPHTEQIRDIADLALRYKLWTPPPDLQIKHQEALLKCAQFAYRLGRSNREVFRGTTAYSYPEHNACFDGAFVLLFAFRDREHHRPDGFFSGLLRSELAWMVRPAYRKNWERIYGFEGEDVAEEAPHDVTGPGEQPFHGQPEWNEIFEHEGPEGNPVDYDEDEGGDADEAEESRATGEPRSDGEVVDAELAGCEEVEMAVQNFGPC